VEVKLESSTAVVVLKDGASPGLPDMSAAADPDATELPLVPDGASRVDGPRAKARARFDPSKAQWTIALHVSSVQDDKVIHDTTGCVVQLQEVNRS
jgi:hypothetical protein